jgi:gamma-glutamylcyclotransferase (GGCT)/AIG2-like uncharacterized protein YtfP
MNEPFLLFVYGQLKRGQIGYRRLGLRHRTQWLRRARVRGRLVDLGDYPGLVVGRHGIVKGELLAFDDASLWSELHAYEQFDPDRLRVSEFRRVAVDLLDGDGRCWAYEYNRPVRRHPVISSGLWIGR